MRVDPKSLVRRLNPATTRMLEGAVGHAAGGQFYEITCDHLLLKLRGLRRSPPNRSVLALAPKFLHQTP